MCEKPLFCHPLVADHLTCCRSAIDFLDFELDSVSDLNFSFSSTI